jgi:hypothetical protein
MFCEYETNDGVSVTRENALEQLTKLISIYD